MLTIPGLDTNLPVIKAMCPHAHILNYYPYTFQSVISPPFLGCGVCGTEAARQFVESRRRPAQGNMPLSRAEGGTLVRSIAPLLHRGRVSSINHSPMRKVPTPARSPAGLIAATLTHTRTRGTREYEGPGVR